MLRVDPLCSARAWSDAVSQLAIPRITADLISALAAIGRLQAPEMLRERCLLVERLAECGRSVDQVTVGELLQFATGRPPHACT